MKKAIAVVAAAVVLTALVATLAEAAAGDIMLADFLWIRLRCPSGGYTVDQRVDEVQARANDLLVLGGFDLSTIRVVKSGPDAIIYANGKLLVTVDQCTARANDSTPTQLATMWAQRLREIFPDVVPKKPMIEQPASRGG